MATNDEIRAKDIVPHKTSFSAGDGFYGDGDDSFFMEAADLLQVTAENAFGIAIAPVFDGTRTEEDKYLPYQTVTYNGKTYTFKNEHYGPWDINDVYESQASFNSPEGLFESIDKTISHSFTTSGTAYLDNVYLPPNGLYTIKVTVSAPCAISLSLKDSNGNNFITYSDAVTGSVEHSVVIRQPCYQIGVWKQGGQNSGTFDIRVTSVGLYERLDNDYDFLSNLVKNNPILVSQDIKAFSNVNHINRTISFDFVAGHFYKVVLSFPNPEYVNNATMSVKKGLKNEYTSASKFFSGVRDLPILFYAEENMAAVGYYVSLSSSSSNSGNLVVSIYDIPLSNPLVSEYNRSRPLILDTDYAWDVDDAFAIRVLSFGIASGKIDLVGVCLSQKNDISIPAIDGEMCEEGVGQVCYGLANYSGRERTYHTLFKDFPNHILTSNSQSYNALDFYKNALKHCPNGQKVDLVILGTLVNLSALIDAQATTDEYSGIELLQKKVRKIWIMGGDLRPGRTEANFRNEPEATYNVLENCPVPMYFQGADFTTYDLVSGQSSYITEGPYIESELGSGDYLWQAYSSWIGESGESKSIAYDPILLLTAIEDNDYMSGVYYKKGHINFDVETKTQTFTESSDGNHFVTYRSFPAYKDFYETKLKNIILKRNLLAFSSSVHRMIQ